MTTRDPLGQDTLIACPQCGAKTPDIDGPTHPYMVSSPGCWRAFVELAADELTASVSPAHGPAVDAYPPPPMAATARSDAIGSRYACT